MMWNASPIKHTMVVVTPMLIALGMEDKQVPPLQGLKHVYHVLRTNGVTTKLIQFDKDNHATS
jgi:acylaminoacyl-peptidase